MGLIPGSGRSPGEGNDYPLQYFYLGNPMDRGAWLQRGIVHGVTRVRHNLETKPPPLSFLCLTVIVHGSQEECVKSNLDIQTIIPYFLNSVDFPVGSVVRNPPAKQRLQETDSIPGSGRFPEEGNGNPLQYSCLENPMDRGSLAGYSPMVSQKGRTRLIN